jgi:hypothetical protein
MEVSRSVTSAQRMAIEFYQSGMGPLGIVTGSFVYDRERPGPSYGYGYGVVHVRRRTPGDKDILRLVRVRRNGQGVW